MFSSTIYQDDLGGVGESGIVGKRAPSELAKSTSVVGLNTNGKMSRHTNPSMTTTTISPSGHLPANHSDEEHDEEEGYLSSSEGEKSTLCWAGQRHKYCNISNIVG